MIENLPLFVSLIFGFTTILTLWMFIKVINTAKSIGNNGVYISILLIFWLILQGVLTLNHVYVANLNSFPPKIFLFGIMPAIITIVSLFFTVSGRKFMDELSLTKITFLNVVRIPVELVLFWLYQYKTIPQLMTFEGRNFDILAGLSAPIIGYFVIKNPKTQRTVLLIWNIFCLGLLINIVVNAFLSTPSPMQQFAFDQPNVAILHFPFSWLPTFIVPVVFFGHLVSFRQLLKPVSKF